VTADFRTQVRHALLLAAAECQPKEHPLTRGFVERVLELLAGAEPERLDPALRAARSAAVLQDDLRDLLEDAAFAAVLPDLERVLRAARVDMPPRAPQRVFAPVAGSTLPWER
jgi:hypothetical protein